MTILGAPVAGVGAAGNVGIGTATPTAKLEVTGNILACGKMLVAGDDTVYDLLALILLECSLAEPAKFIFSKAATILIDIISE